MSLESIYNEQGENINSVFNKSLELSRNFLRKNASGVSAKNRPASNRSTVKRNCEVLMGGLDTLELGYFGTFEDFAMLVSSLESKIFEMRNNHLDYDYIFFGKLLFRINNKSARVGRLVYKYYLEFHGMTFLIHSNPSKNVQSIRIKVGGKFFVSHNLQDFKRLRDNVFYYFGFRYDTEIISRADLMVMLPIHINDVVEDIRNNQISSECRGSLAVFSSANGNIETIFLKSRTCELCIYDKMKELERQSPEYFNRFCSKYGFHLALTRFEYRFARAALKRWGIDSVTQLEAVSSSLLSHFSFDWFRIHSKASKGNECRSSISKLWLSVRNTFNGVFQNLGSAPLVRFLIKKELPDVKRTWALFKGAASSILSYFKELSDVTIQDLIDIISPVFGEIREKVKIKSKNTYLFDY